VGGSVRCLNLRECKECSYWRILTGLFSFFEKDFFALLDKV